MNAAEGDIPESRANGLQCSPLNLRSFGMRDWQHGVATLAASLWVGGMWAIGYLAVPLLFQSLPDNRMLAGELAGRLFTATAYAGMLCAVYLAVYSSWRARSKALRLRIFWLIIVMLLLTLLGQFGLQPLMAELKAQAWPQDVAHGEFADRFRLLHGAASLTYLLQTLLGIVLLLKLDTLRRAS